LLILLCVTVIGIAAVPFAVGALFCMSLFGKAVMLAWLGGRITGRGIRHAGHPAVAVLIGGAVVLVLRARAPGWRQSTARFCGR
jgi:hypothetical protein